MGTEGSRLKRVGWGPGEDRIRTSPATWAKPLQWQRIALAAGVTLDVFCLSLGDWADNEVDDRWRLDLADVILRTPNLRWLLLTKRIPNVERYLRAMFPQGVPPNVCLGITVVTQAEVERDVPRAISVKRALGVKRLFLSMEPLLESIDLEPYLWEGAVDLVIVGGESGKKARPLHPEWAINIARICHNTGARFHFKQWGEFRPYRADNYEPSNRAADIGMVHFKPRKGPFASMERVGAKKAGRVLAGREWLERIPA